MSPVLEKTSGTCTVPNYVAEKSSLHAITSKCYSQRQSAATRAVTRGNVRRDLPLSWAFRGVGARRALSTPRVSNPFGGPPAESQLVQLIFSLANRSTIPRQAHQQNVWVSSRNVGGPLRRRRLLEVFRWAGAEPDQSPRRTDGCWHSPSYQADRQCGEVARRPH